MSSVWLCYVQNQLMSQSLQCLTHFTAAQSWASANGKHIEHHFYYTTNTYFDSSGNAAMSFPHATQDAETHINFMLVIQGEEACKIFRNY